MGGGFSGAIQDLVAALFFSPTLPAKPEVHYNPHFVSKAPGLAGVDNNLPELIKWSFKSTLIMRFATVRRETFQIVVTYSRPLQKTF